jgi:hypothetical protein
VLTLRSSASINIHYLRGIVLRALILIGVLFAVPAFAREWHSFEFMGFNTASTYVGTVVVSGKTCKLKGEGEEQCIRPSGAVVANVPITRLTLKFNDGKLFLISGEAHITQAVNLRNALATKYGPPTTVEDAPWRNPMPANFSKEVAIWRFSDGTLELRTRGDRRDFSQFTFIAKNSAPARYTQDQPINF